MKAIKDVGGNLIAALDPHDSVGILDSYFPDCAFFTEFERFDRFCSKREGQIDYVVVASPNFLHDSHCRFSLRIGANVICEKPLVLNERNLDELLTEEHRHQRSIFTILQLRLHENVITLKKDAESGVLGNVGYAKLTYVTPRGKWYKYSWKANLEKSGGLITNIGVHLIDMLLWVFGPATYVSTHRLEVGENDTTAWGKISFQKCAGVEFYLSIEPLPNEHSRVRSLVIDNYKVDFTIGFENLHTESYRAILTGRGFGIDDVYNTTKLCRQLRRLRYGI